MVLHGVTSGHYIARKVKLRGRRSIDGRVNGVPISFGHKIKVGLVHKLSKLGPKGLGGMDGPTPVGVIIGNVPSSGGVEHEVSSRGTCLVDGQVNKGGGGRANKIPPKSDKHVPNVSGS